MKGREKGGIRRGVEKVGNNGKGRRGAGSREREERNEGEGGILMERFSLS